MGDVGIDVWSRRMEEHKSKSHYIIMPGNIVDKKTVNEIEQELILKEQRAKFWEKYHSIPTDYDLIWRELEV